MTRDVRITVRLSEEEARDLDAAAKREDVPIGQLARRGIKHEIERLAAKAKKERRP